MKSLKIACLAIASFAFVAVSNAQTKTETFKVSGNCGMCKSKIEKAALEAGAKSASWDMESKLIRVSYKSSTTNAAKIQDRIAKAGYDNAGSKATDDSYNKLHGCCKYERTHEGAMDQHEAKAACCKDGKCSKEGHNGKDCCSSSKQQQ